MINQREFPQANLTSQAAQTTVTVIPGDGIGPEITEAVQDVLAAAGAPILWDVREAGLGCIERAGNGLPEETMASILRNRIALKGPTATPIGGGHKSVNVTIRKSLDLYANVRPVKSLPGVESRYANVDMIIVRENVEDTYGGIEHRQTSEVTQCLKVITRPGTVAIVRYAFDLAQAWGRKRVTCVHKANIHKMTDGLFLEVFREVAAEYPDIQSDDMLIDNTCMQLVTAPERFDVLVMPNLYGDIVSDLAAGLVGGLGVAPGGNIGRDLAVFEAVHGTAPDIAGKGLANPTALLLSAIQMLRYLGYHRHAERIEQGLHVALSSGVKTRDLGGLAGTREFVAAIVDALPPESVDIAVSQVSRVAAEAKPQRSPQATGVWANIGVDLFIEHDGVPQLPERIGKLKLVMISNRGTKVYPGPVPDILLVNWHRCRYVAEEPISDLDLIALLAEMNGKFTWMHLEKLRTLDGVPQYSKAQGE